MSQAAEPRITVDLPVRVWGMTADGRPFTQHARAQNISSEGALLAGIENELKVGDVVGVQCEERKTRCTVMWVMNTGPIRKNQVGVRLLAGQECPWKAYLPVEGASPTILPGNRRRWPRHKISFPIELRDERVNTPMRISATDVSGNGCYVETIMPMPAGTVLRVEFYLQEQRMTITAVIRTCDPGVGNGIEFTGMSIENKEHLQSYLDGIDPGMGVSANAPEEPA